MGLSVQSDEHYMKEAMRLAKEAANRDEIPVGAVVVASNTIIAKAYNQTEMLNDPTAHAELIAITAACNHLGSKYLNECTLYVTLEPCGMCAGALYWSQIGRIVFAATDEKRGYRNVNAHMIHPKTKVEHGLMADEAGNLVSDFFKKLRNK